MDGGSAGATLDDPVGCKTMSEHRTFTLAIADTDPLSRAGIRAVFSAANTSLGLELVWESESYDQTLSELERLSPDLLIISLPECELEHTELFANLSQRFRHTAKLLVTAPPKTSDICYRLLQAGLDGYVKRDDLAVSFEIAVSSILASANWLSKCFTEKLIDASASPPSITMRGYSAQQLTRREEEIIQLMTMGRSNAEMAISLGLHQRTIRHHLRKAYDKLEVSGPSQAILRVLSS